MGDRSLRHGGPAPVTPPLGRIMFRDLSPVTPGGFPARGVAGDPVPVAVTLVRDGHGLLAGRARWRPIGATTWDVAPLQDRMDGSGRWVGCFAPAAPGMYEFEVQAWWDRFATWRRDLRERAAAAQDLTVEFEVGARLIESMLDLVDPPARDRLGDAVSGLRSASCSEQVRLAVGLDDAVAGLLDGVTDPVVTVVSGRHRLRVTGVQTCALPISACASTGNGRCSAAGTSSSPDQRAASSPERARGTGSRRWPPRGSTCCTCRRSTRSG